MYIPKPNEEKDVSVLHSLIKSKPLGTWVTISDGELEINHIPFILHEDQGEFGTIAGHVARSNTIFQRFSQDVDSVVVFQGDQAYITPSWYPSKHEDGKVVPTWNYAVVHVHGVPKTIKDPSWLLQHLNELTDSHESKQALPWKVSDAPTEFIETLTGAIVGIEIPITKIIGKWKLGQNRSEADKLGTIAGLRSSNDSESYRLADILSGHLQTKSKG